ncbi:uncharacterized protein LOC112569625 isoform X2 [Pomacea canaliculata]|uniref:uncharacterized protein LOC112569625 isoform X2 n=1 Tax=Pomacea canaliculata TaxID=400727 RepID=UPI000D7376EE|nr:uncharacterized protein LOC112569625 isoform X2 [Pomacea canaliculata]
MSQPRSVLTSLFTLLVFITVAYTHLENCAVLEFLHLSENMCIKQNDFVNLTFWLNTSGCETSDTLYRLTVKVKTDKYIADDEGRLTVINGTCDVTTGTLLRCVSPAGPVELYSKVNTSHIETEWKWWWKENGSYTHRSKTLHITACALSYVTNLTVNGQESKGTFIADVGQNISVYCAFTKGNPPTTFRLLDRNGGEIDVSKDESHIIHSLAAVSCEEDWPVIRCEGNRSTENKFVSLLVRCPPQFTDMAPKFVYPDVNDHVIFNIKAHSTTLSGCLLTRASTEENLRQKVNCSLHGIPPNLTLNITLHNEVKLILGNWTLNITNDMGSGEIVLTFIASSETTSRLITIIGVLSCAAILTIAVFFAIQRIKKQKGGKRTRLSAGNRDQAREITGFNSMD